MGTLDAMETANTKQKNGHNKYNEANKNNTKNGHNIHNGLNENNTRKWAQ